MIPIEKQHGRNGLHYLVICPRYADVIPVFGTIVTRVKSDSAGAGVAITTSRTKRSLKCMTGPKMAPSLKRRLKATG